MGPILCNYYVTLRCNSRCEFCDIWKNKSNLGLKEQNLEEVERNLRDLRKLGVRVIDFTGGEPLLYPHIVEALRLAKRYKFYTFITTNSLLYPRLASKLKGLVDVLQFSFESPDEEKHNKIRGVDSYKKVIESMETAKKIKQKVSLIHTVTDQNLKNIPELVKFAQKNKCTLALNPAFEYFGNNSLSKENAAKLKKYFDEPYVVIDLAWLELIIRGGNDPANPICKAISSTIVISPDNCLLLPCYHRHFNKIKIENNLFELYDSDEIKNLKKSEGKFNFCKNCTIYCYMRGSLYRDKHYAYLVLKSAYNYLRERFRRQF
jgi:MoaA/NifB/PqqE/SkfB family radical SAM enzyme